MTVPGTSGSLPMHFNSSSSNTRLTTVSSSSNGGHGHSESSTRSMLNLLQERISGFEKQVANEAANRRTSEEHKVQTLKESIGKLEKSLDSEIKRRVDGNKQLTQMFTQEVTMVQNKLEKLFLDKLDQLQTAIDSLNERTARVEKDFYEEKQSFQEALERQTSAAGKDILLLQAAFDNEKTCRNERENAICKRIGDLEERTEHQIEKEKSIREQRYQAVVESVEEIRTNRETDDEKFQTFALEEIAYLKNGLVAESQGRERADDDIVQAINHYTKALQDALRLINSA